MKVYGQLESAQLENSGSDPSKTPYGRLYFHTGLLLAKLYTSLGWANLAMHRVSGSVGAPNSLTSSGPTLLADGSHQMHFIKGTGGVTLNTNLTDGLWVGQQLKFKGTSDTDFYVIPDNLNTKQNGDWFGNAGATIQYTWDGSDWSEDFRR